MEVQDSKIILYRKRGDDCEACDIAEHLIATLFAPYEICYDTELPDNNNILFPTVVYCTKNEKVTIAGLKPVRVYKEKYEEFIEKYQIIKE